MPQRQPLIDRFRVMHGNNEPVTVVPDIENHKAIHIVGIGKTSPEFLKVPPPGRLDGFDPCADLAGGVAILLGRLLQSLDRDDVHNYKILRNLRRVKKAQNYNRSNIFTLGTQNAGRQIDSMRD